MNTFSLPSEAQKQALEPPAASLHDTSAPQQPASTAHHSSGSAPSNPSAAKNSPQNISISPIQYLRGIGPRRAEALALAGIVTAADVLKFYPRSYIDRASVPSLRELRNALVQAQQTDAFSDHNMKLQSEITVVAYVRAVRERTFGKNRTMVVVELDDNSGVKAEIVFWNQAEYFKRIYEPNQLLAVSGLADFSYGKIQFAHPEIDKIDPDDAELYGEGRILPKYRLTQKMREAGISMRVLRNVVQSVIEQELPNLHETLSASILQKYDFPDIQHAVRQLHFPDSHHELEKARERMKYEELFFFGLVLAMRHKGTKTLDAAPPVQEKSPLARTMLEQLPFELTKAQKRVLREIMGDMRTKEPMNRLLQGDVGSGKTVVALLAMLAAIDSGYQCALMAPTEILAEQHYNTITDYCAKLNDHRTAQNLAPINVVQLIGGQKKRQRTEIGEKISSGEAHIVVGTHALFQSAAEYKRLAFVVIDEQHRFGVLQRAELKNKASASFQENECISAPNQSPTEQAVAQTFLSVNPAESTGTESTVAQTFLSVNPVEQQAFEQKRRNLPHWRMQGAYYFLTFRAISVLSADEQQIVFQHILEGNGVFYELFSCCVMPDHVHIILRVFDEKYTLSDVLKGIKGASANKVNKYRQVPQNHVWQDESFDRIIRNQDEFEEKFQYIQANPSEANLVQRGEKYPFYWSFVQNNTMQHSQTRMSVPLRAESQPESLAQDSQTGSLKPLKDEHLPKVQIPLAKNLAPHVLVMSATPIPRTLSMTLYGDLDVSVIDELPKNRKPIKTKVVFESKMPLVWDFIKEQVQKGRQAYVVYPLVEKSEKVEAKSAVEHFEYLQKEVFPDVKLGLLHGQMFWYEKEDAMKAFKNREFHILVATTVVEVGIDVPNASVMLIENAERFGLAQLHQLRGRVGRGAEQSYCLLATKDHFKFHLNKRELQGKNEGNERKACIIRLKTMQETTDGFKIAEVDLGLRGPGDFMGTRQSGVPEFAFADLMSDGDVISTARNDAFALIADDAQLQKPENATIRTEFMRQNSRDYSLLDVA
ncbi:MAG: DEAD/DEAH box helicase [Candidatus Kapaibacterium sp.]|nr:MAG: DEAD/DEAH box helicase [Candidatus Kapabacteria bacterium]